MTTPVIKMRKIRLDVTCTEKEIKQYGGVKNLRELLLNILERYAYPEYYDPGLVGEFTKPRGGERVCI